MTSNFSYLEFSSQLVSWNVTHLRFHHHQCHGVYLTELRMPRSRSRSEASDQSEDTPVSSFMNFSFKNCTKNAQICNTGEKKREPPQSKRQQKQDQEFFWRIFCSRGRDQSDQGTLLLTCRLIIEYCHTRPGIMTTLLGARSPIRLQTKGGCQVLR